MKKSINTALALILAIGVAGCQNRPKSRFNDTQAMPLSAVDIQGNWRATDGPLLATFNGTKFQSVNITNNQVVAAGAFEFNSDQDIRLEWVGALSGRSSAQCRLIDPDLMSCKPSNGSGFEMRRV
jgi:uncharacterized lipoprotein NlpE involved in copper resistance